MQSVTITKNQAGQRLDKFLKKYLPEAESGFLYKMLRKKNITLNGKKADGKEMLAQEDTVSFFFSEETFAKFRGIGGGADKIVGQDIHDEKMTASVNSNNGVLPGKYAGNNAAVHNTKNGPQEYQKAYKTLRGITILYEDEDVLIVNKPAGVLTQKAKPVDMSLNEWLIGYLLNKGSIDEEELQTFHPSVCNRLDRNTSGIVLCGKSLPGSQVLSRVIRERSVRKFYHTICLGQLCEEAVIEGYLQKDEATNKVRISTKESGSVPKGASKDAESYIKTAYHPLAITGNYTLLEVELITGKTHQIRAHLASIGHPIIGDYKYGNNKANNSLKQQFGLEAQLLHARRIEFPTEAFLPEGLRGLVITAPYPKMFEQLKGLVG